MEIYYNPIQPPKITNSFLKDLDNAKEEFMNKSEYYQEMGSFEMIRRIYLECRKYSIPQQGCVLIGRKNQKDYYIHFNINSENSTAFLKDSA